MTAKQQAIKLLRRLDDDVSFDEIQYQLYVRQMVQAGLDDVEAGRILSHDQVMKRVARCLTPSAGRR